MTMEFRPSYGGPYVGKTDDMSPQNAVWKLVQRYRGTTKEKLEKMRNKLEKLYVSQCREDPELADSNARYAFTNALTSILRKMELEEASNVEEYEVKREARKAADAERKEVVKKAVAAAKRSFVLNFVMTHRFGELSKLAAAHKNVAKIAKMGKPSQFVSDVLSESDVLKVLNGK